MKFGISLMLQGDGEKLTVTLPDLLEEAIMAEKLGFDCVGAGEYHSRGAVIQPIPVLGALASHLKRIRIASLFLVLPLHHPYDIAAHAATLDYLAPGRFILGLARGFAAIEFEAFGVPLSERASRFNEALEVIKVLWRKDVANYAGRHFRLSGVTLFPKPLRPDGPPIWLAAFSEASISRAAALADAWVPDPLKSFSTLEREYRFYREALARHGRLDQIKDYPLMRIAHIERDGDSARATVKLDIMNRYRRYWTRWGADRFTGLGRSYDYNELLKDRMLVGSPDEVIAQIEALQRIGANLLILRFRQPNLRHRQVVDSIRLFHSRVLSYFNDKIDQKARE